MAEQAIVADMVRFRINDGLSAPGYLARPAAAGKHPGVVVIQEWWGLDDHIQDVARRFAQEGYVALAPDLYHGKVAEEPDEARKLAMEMDRVRAVREIGYSAQHLVDSDYVAGDQVGVIGFCMGGGLTLLTACKSRLVAAAAAFYGGNPRPIEQLGNIACPVLAIYGEEDRPLWPAAADQWRRGQAAVACGRRSTEERAGSVQETLRDAQLPGRSPRLLQRQPSSDLPAGGRPGRLGQGARAFPEAPAHSSVTRRLIT